MQPTDVLEAHPTLGQHDRVIDYMIGSRPDLAALRQTLHLSLISRAPSRFDSVESFRKTMTQPDPCHSIRSA
jgi:hypothetical protein